MSGIFKMKHPASGFGGNWRECTPLGNGIHGAVMYGRIHKEKITLTHTELWRGAFQPAIPDVSDVLAHMQQAILDGKLPEADGMLCDALIQRGYAPQLPNIMPAADINIQLPMSGIFKKYSRELDMETGEGRVKFDIDGKTYSRRAFVSRADDVVVIECDKNSIIDVSVHEPDIPFYKDSDVLAKNQTVQCDGEWIFLKCDIYGVEHGVVARVIRGETALVIARVYCSGSHLTEWGRLKDYISELPTSYQELFARHMPVHRELFCRCRFELDDTDANFNLSNEELLDIAYDDELPNALTQRMWDYGRYLFISGTAENAYPCSLTGLWCPEYNAMWSFNMANINIEMIYWQCMPGHLDELMLPVFDYYSGAMDDMRENATKIYGCRGIFLPAVTAPGSMKHTCMSPHIVNWTGGAGWIAQLYYDYYIFTRDEKFLAETALPFMREAALFYRDFIIRSENEWHICPSVSPENQTSCYKGTPTHWAENVQSAVDAAMDVAIIKELCTNLLCASDITGLIPEDEAEDYRWIKNHAPEYKVNEYGAPREWLCDDFADNDRHRHQSHLYPMFPGFERVRESRETDAVYREGGIRRLTVGADCQTSWSLIQNANMAARTGDGELALRSLNIIAKTSIMANLFTNHNDWRGSGLTLTMQYAPFQIDANIGWPSAVMEMLVFSSGERTDILPALPEKWNKGSIKGLRTRCGTEVSVKWESDTCMVNIVALRDTRFMLYMPDGEVEEIEMKQGDEAVRTCALKRIKSNKGE